MYRLILLFLCTAPVFSQVEVQTAIEQIALGPDTRTGIVTFTIDDDAFPEARPWNPVYLRLQLEEGLTLSETLASGWGDEIYLPLRSRGSATLITPALTLSVLRWREGESSIWLRISVPTSKWLLVDGAAAPPSAENRVSFTLGLDADQYRAVNEDDFDNGLANLPVAVDDGVAAGTPLILDVTEDAITDLPLISFESYEASRGLFANIGWPVPEHRIRPGHDLEVPFSGDLIIAVVRF